MSPFMSPIGLLTGAGVMIVSVTLGIGLGNFAAGHDRGRWSAPAERLSMALPDATGADGLPASVAAVETRDEPVHCKGCGPTLAERQMAMSEAGYGALGYGLGAEDPMVRRYMRDAAAEEAHWRQRDAERAVAERMGAERVAAVPTPAAIPIRTIGPAAQPIAVQRMEMGEGVVMN